MELCSCIGARYDLERFGIEWSASPKFAKILLVSGPLALNNVECLKEVYSAMPKPKRVIALGTCAMSGGMFADSENDLCGGPIKKAIPVDWKIPGCPPRPEVIIEGIMNAIRQKN